MAADGLKQPQEILTPQLPDERIWKNPAELFAAENMALVSHARSLMFAYSLPIHHAEDVVQDAWADLTAQWDGVRRPLPWIYAVVKNKAARIARPMSAADEDLEPIAQQARWISLPVTASMEASVEAQEALRAIVGLPDRQQVAAYLRFVADLEYADIAERMKIDRGTVSAHLAKARKNIGAKLGRTGAFLIILATALGVITVRPDRADAAQPDPGNGGGPDAAISPLPDPIISAPDTTYTYKYAILQEKVARLQLQIEQKQTALDALQLSMERETASALWKALLSEWDQVAGATTPTPPAVASPA